MARSIPYVMCRYEMTMHERPLSGEEQLQVLRAIRGTLVTHRKSEPGPDDADTLIMRPKSMRVDDRLVLTWDVGQQLTGRTEAKYDHERDEVRREWSGGDAIRYTSFVAVPSLRVVAVNDRVGDIYLGSTSGISRLKSIFR